MTVVDPRAAPSWAGRTAGEPDPGWAAPDREPPAGPDPWVPPLPAPRPALSPRALTWFGVAAVTLLIGAAAATVVMIEAAVRPELPSPDERYLGSVRANSTLTRLEVDDDTLTRTGYEVCATLDRRPTLPTVLGTMRELGLTRGWRDDDVAAVVGSAIGAYCPRHIPVLDR